MQHLRRTATLLLAVLMTSALWAAPQHATTLLPASFAGWEKSSSRTSTDPGAADPTDAGLLKENGFADFEQATYKRDARQMQIKAARFSDASGAYAAFTFYKRPEMLNEKFGEQGASLNERILFYRGNVLVQATLEQTTAMSAAEMRELANSLPQPNGPAASLPTLPQYLPKQAYVKNSAKYILGSTGLSAAGAPLTAEQVEFGRGAEVAQGKYSTSKGTATLMLVAYPTPQIAAERLRYIETLGGNSTASVDPSLAPPFITKRTGPILVLAAGQISDGEAKSLLAAVNYDANVTWNENTFLSKKNNVANLLVNVVLLIAVIFGFALVAGVAFGGLRILAKRFWPGRVFDRSDELEIIQLRLGTGKGTR